MTRGFDGLLSIARMESVDYEDRGPGDPQGRFTGFRSVFAAPLIQGRRPSGWGTHAAFCIQRVTMCVSPCLASWTLALLALNLVYPGMPMREILRKPGTIAGLAWIGGFLAVGLSTPGTLIVKGSPGSAVESYWRDWWYLTWFDLPRAAGFVVAVTWTTLWLIGGFDPEGEWRDRLGRVLGMCWMVLGFSSLLSQWLQVVWG
jgi:hypothetical protein